MKRLYYLFICLFILASVLLKAQSQEVSDCLSLVASGQIDEVKKLLPDMLAEYPDDPGVELLHAVVIEDGYLALDKYMNIIKNYPKSQWADDAYWRVVQFYSIIGDTAKAKSHLHTFREKYPSSEFLLPASDVAKTAINLARMNARKKEVKIDEQAEEIIDKKELIKQKISQLKKAISKKKPLDKIEKKIEHQSESKKVIYDDISIIEDEIEIEKSNGKYGLQVGIYSTYESAKSEVERFNSKRMLAEIKNKTLDGIKMYSVIIGDYSSMEKAENAKHIVQQQCKCIPIIFEK